MPAFIYGRSKSVNVSRSVDEAQYFRIMTGHAVDLRKIISQHHSSMQQPGCDFTSRATSPSIVLKRRTCRRHTEGRIVYVSARKPSAFRVHENIHPRRNRSIIGSHHLTIGRTAGRRTANDNSCGKSSPDCPMDSSADVQCACRSVTH